MRRTALIAGLAAATALSLVPAAQASFHEMQIRQIHPDVDTNNEWVMLQMFTPGQNFVAGHSVRSYDFTGGTTSTYTFPNSNCPSSGIVQCLGDNQRTILLGNQATVGGVASDFDANATFEMSSGGGAVCFLSSLGTPTDAAADEAIDCVAYGSFAGFSGNVITAPSQGPFANVAVGTPAEPGGLADDTTLQRSIALGCPSLLEGPDDTNSSVADFSVSAAAPRNNLSAPVETPCGPPPPPLFSPIAITAGAAPSVSSTVNQARCNKLKKQIKKTGSPGLKRKLRTKLRNAGCFLNPNKP